MLKKLFLLSTLLLTSVSTQAALISHFGYERDSASNIVTGGGLDWLKWDVTKGMSINSALSSYASQGWRLASNDEMSSMFNRFKFGNIDWRADETVWQSVVIPWNSGDVFSSPRAFMRLFGSTFGTNCDMNVVRDCFVEDSDQMLEANAFFGEDLNKNGLYSIAAFFDTWRDWRYVDRDRHVAQFGDQVRNTDAGRHYGVALVRNSVPDNVAVPTPGSIGLLALGLVALGYRRHLLGR